MKPDAMSHAAREHRERPDATPPSARRLLFLLVVLLVLGSIGTTASILTARGQQNATRDDVERNRELLQRVADLEAMNGMETEEHRRRNELLHADICRLIYDVVITVPTLKDQGIKPCAPPLLAPPTPPPGG